MSLGETLRVARTTWPLLGRAIVSGQLFKPRCELTPPDPDILCEYDVEVPVADGIVLTANVFRSRKAQDAGVRVPAVMCGHPDDNQLIPALGKTPFGGPPPHYRIVPQVGRPRFSTITSWESPDPDFWVPAGYAVGQSQSAGFGTRAGAPTLLSDRQAKSFHEAIEWNRPAELVHRQGGAERRQLPCDRAIPWRQVSALMAARRPDRHVGLRGGSLETPAIKGYLAGRLRLGA